MHIIVYVAVLIAFSGTASAWECSRGDTACWCKDVGGEWRQGKPPMLPACRIFYSHQGRRRWVNVFLPKGYDGMRDYSLWVHLHGVFWNTMANIGQQLGPVDSTDIIPYWDRAVQQFSDQAIIVYPQSLGNPGTGDSKADTDPIKGPKYRQFWNIPFWHCSVGVCADQTVDDMGFLEMVFADLQKRFAVNSNQILLSGESAGGMMVQAILCESSKITSQITAAVDILGGIAREYVLGPSCRRSPAVAFMKLHGVKDPFITWKKDILVDGVNFISAIGGAKRRAAQNGCFDKDYGYWYTDSTGHMACRDLCGKKRAAMPARVCGMKDVAHGTDDPWPGFVYQQTWRFFQEQINGSATNKRKPSGNVDTRG